MLLSDVKAALLSVTTKTYHYTASGAICPYAVWAEDNQSDSLNGDGQMVKQVMQGTIHLFTKAEYDPLFKAIPTALINASISYRFNSTQYEEDTKIIHHEWIFDIPMEM